MAVRHRTPVAPGNRCWAACVIVLQCERGGRPVTAIYGFWALLYSAFGAQDLSDEAATTSLLGALAAAFALAVRVIATMSMGEGRAAAAEVALHCLGCAGVAFAAWALVHDAAAPADAHGHGRLALALCAGAAPALLAARFRRTSTGAFSGGARISAARHTLTRQCARRRRRRAGKQTPRASGRSGSARRSRASAPRRPRRRGVFAAGGGRGGGAGNHGHP